MRRMEGTLNDRVVQVKVEVAYAVSFNVAPRLPSTEERASVLTSLVAWSTRHWADSSDSV